MLRPMSRATRVLSLVCSALIGLALAAPAGAVVNLNIIAGANGTGTQDANLTADGTIALGDPDIGGNTLSVGALETVGATTNIAITVNSGTLSIANLGGNQIDLLQGPGFSAAFAIQGGGSIVFANPAADGFTTAGGALNISGQAVTFGRANTNGGTLGIGGGSGLTVGGPLSSGAGNLTVQAVGTPLTINFPVTTTTGAIIVQAGSGSTQTLTNNAAITSTSGTITGAGDRIVLNPGSSMATGAMSVVTLTSATIGTVMDVGTAADAGLGVSAAELATITAGSLRLNADGGMNITAPLVSPAPTLRLTAGFVTQSAGATISVANLSINAVNAITFIPGNSIGTLSTNSTGTLNYSDLDALTIGTVFGEVGVENDGPITIASGAAAALTLDSLVRAIPSGSVTLTPGSGLTINATGDITAGSGAFTQNGAVPVSTAGDIAATSLTFAGNVTLTGTVALVANAGAIDFNGALAIGLTSSTMSGTTGVILGNPGTAFSVTANGAGTTGVINANGPVATSDAALVVTSAGGVPGGTSLTIVNNDGADAVLGTFQGLAEGATVNAGAQNFRISYVGGTGNDIVLLAGVAPAITSANATTFTVGTAGTFTVTTTGSPTPTLSVMGALPTGVTFVDNGNGTATLSGTPAAGTGGTYPITITAANGTPPNATQAFTLTVNQAPAITSTNATTFTVGTAGTFSVTTTGFPTAALTSMGALPAGVTFTDNGNGTATLAGTPGAGTGGTYPITITANNGVAPNATQSFTLTVNQAPAITSANATTFTVGTAGTFTVTTTGFPAAALSAMGALPAGVTFTDNGNGTATLAGTPGAGTGGTYPITITAANGTAPNATQSFTLTVNQAPAITSANATSFTVGVAGTFTVTSTGFPTAALSTMGTLPTGVTFVDNGNGTATLSGTPAAGSGGTYPLTFTAANGVAPNATQAFTLTVTAPPTITSANQTTFTVGVAGTFTVTTTGFPAPAITVMGALPAGVTFVDNGNGTGTLSGTPAAGTRGFYPLTFTASNGTLPNATQPFVLNVFDPSPIPALDRFGLALLLALVLGVAFVMLRRTHG